MWEGLAAIYDEVLHCLVLLSLLSVETLPPAGSRAPCAAALLSAPTSRRISPAPSLHAQTCPRGWCRAPSRNICIAHMPSAVPPRSPTHPPCPPPPTHQPRPTNPAPPL